jgi:hypothetical protein
VIGRRQISRPGRSCDGSNAVYGTMRNLYSGFKLNVSANELDTDATRIYTSYSEVTSLLTTVVIRLIGQVLTVMMFKKWLLSRVR